MCGLKKDNKKIRKEKIKIFYIFYNYFIIINILFIIIKTIISIRLQKIFYHIFIFILTNIQRIK